MAANSFQSGFSLEWKIRFFAGLNCQSSMFHFMNSKWNLQIVSYNDRETNQYFFNLNLLNLCGTNSFKPFQIRTFLVSYAIYTPILCSTLNIFSPSNSTILYVGNFSEIEKKLGLDPRFQSEVSIMCVVFLSYGRSLDTTAEKIDKSTQESADCECQNKDGVSSIDSSVTSLLKSSKLSMKSLLHLESLSKDMGDMLQESIMTDTQLKCGEVVIPAHKAVLASRSKVFSSMFQHEMVENITGTVDIQDIEPSILQEFLRYLYTGMISEDLPAEIFLKLYKASDKYEVCTLQEACSDIMVRKLNEENFIEFLLLGEEHSDQKLQDAVADFVIEHPTLMTMDIWIKFSDEFPKLANEILTKYMKKKFSK